MAVPTLVLAGDLVGGDVEGGEQAGGAVADALSAAAPTTNRHHRRGGSVDSFHMSNRRGLSPNARQMWEIALCDRPVAWAGPSIASTSARHPGQGPIPGASRSPLRPAHR